MSAQKRKVVETYFIGLYEPILHYQNYC